MVMPMNFMGMNSYQNQGSNVNVYHNLHEKYGCGHIDFSERPKVAGYGNDVVVRRNEPVVKKSWFARFIQKCYG